MFFDVILLSFVIIYMITEKTPKWFYKENICQLKKYANKIFHRKPDIRALCSDVSFWVFFGSFFSNIENWTLFLSIFEKRKILSDKKNTQVRKNPRVGIFRNNWKSLIQNTQVILLSGFLQFISQLLWWFKLWWYLHIFPYAHRK